MFLQGSSYGRGVRFMLMAGCFDTRETAAGAVVFVKRRGEESLLTSTAHVNMKARIGSLPLVRYTGYELSSLDAGWNTRSGQKAACNTRSPPHYVSFINPSFKIHVLIFLGQLLD